MSDLEDDLLALAGGEDNTYESAEEEEEEEEIPLSKRKQTTTGSEDEDDTVLSKRRKVDYLEDAQEDDEEEEEEEELINPYPLEGKYRDEDDRAELEDMPEVRREQILFEREQEMDKFKEKKYLQDRMKRQKQVNKYNTGLAQEEPTRVSGRAKTGIKAEKKDKLNELRKQHEFDDYEESVQWGGVSKVKKPKVKKSTEVAKLEDVNKITFGWRTFQQYCFNPGFEEAVVDTFGRINIGPDKVTRRDAYRMVKIIGVKLKKDRTYKWGNSRFDIYLTVSQNRNQVKDFPINFFSNSPITEEEFERYNKELKKTDEGFDLLDDVNAKFEEVNAFFAKGLTDQDINSMIERKKRLNGNKGGIRAVDAVTQKTNLMDELKIAKQQGNFNKVSQILSDLKHIEKILQDEASSNVQSKESVISKVNERNRKLNSTNIRKAEIKNKALAGQQANDGGDPFSRLKTTTKMFYQDLINQENEKALKEVNMQELIDEKNKQEEEISKSTYRELGEMEKLIRSIDFEIELEL
ncbi:RNA polymerase-associated protein RTF1 [Candida viswanathii]|uniref:RNA polymerase-associated protein RTF1 n=1 Tax=Candida viswanathii TaxID=5486 RepID=A0A367YI79_9ASCO|nr:RNA polymerase-associated protein RTF1 [Candida viswanathii]